MPRQYDLVRRGVRDRDPLAGLLNYEDLDDTIRDAGQQIHDQIKAVRDGIIEWIKETTGIDLSGIAEFGDAVFDAIAQALHVPSGGEVMQLLQGLLTLNPFDFINRLGELVGGDFDLGIPAIFGRLEDRLAGLRLDGGVDASKLFGELPQDIINFLRSVITAVFNPSWLSNLVTGQIGTGWSANLQTNPDFDGDVSVAPSPGVEHDATVYPPGGKGSVKMTADGTRKSTAGVLIEGSAGQSVRVGAKLRWAGVVRSTTGRAFTIEVSPYDSSGAELAPVVVTGVNNPGASSGWQEIVADIPWPAGAVKLKPRLAVESFVTAGTVHWSAFQIRKGGALPQDRIKDLPADLAAAWGRAQDAIDSIMNGLGHVGSLFSPSHLAAALENIPVTAISGLNGLLGNLLPIAQWQSFLAGLGNSAGTGAGGSTGIPGVDDALNWIGGLFGKAQAAQQAAVAVNQTVQTQAITTGTQNGMTWKRQSFTSSGTWNIPAASSGKKIVRFDIQVIGGGNGGAKPNNRSASQAPGGLGGGLGRRSFTPDELSMSSYSVTVGTGGAGNTSGGMGGLGGRSSVGTLVQSPEPGTADVYTAFGSFSSDLKPGNGGYGAGCMWDSDGTTIIGMIGGDGTPSVYASGGTGARHSGWPSTNASNAQSGSAATADPFASGGGGGGGGGRSGGSTNSAGAPGGAPGGGGGGGGGGTSAANGANGAQGRVDIWTWEVDL